MSCTLLYDDALSKVVLAGLDRDSTLGTGMIFVFTIATGYGLDDRGSRVRFPEGAGNFSLHHRVHNYSGAHPASYSMGTEGKAAGP
jgi:hypothetical protein